MTTLRVLALGDVVGRPGRDLVISMIEPLRQELRADLVIVNGENAAGGMGLSSDIGFDFFEAGVDVITLGDHTWGRSDLKGFLNQHSTKCIRPGNYPKECPGRGWTVVETDKGDRIGVLNLMGRVFMNGALDCPFAKLEEFLSGPLKDCKVRILDMHAEATSEKWAIARYADSRLSFVFGTHTHVQTSDNQVLPGGTGYITDLGMCGPIDSVLGLKTDISIKRFTTGMRFAYEAGPEPAALHGAICEIDLHTGKALSVERVERRG